MGSLLGNYYDDIFSYLKNKKTINIFFMKQKLAEK